MAEFGVAAHWMYKQAGPAPRRPRAARPRARRAPRRRRRTPRRAVPMARRASAGCTRCSTGSRSSPIRRSSWTDCASASSRTRSTSSRPKGDVKALAAGATPLDFAYEVHTEIGHRCVGARVNGKIVPLHYELQNGDQVEILTAKRERGPSRDWLAVAKTTRARKKIKAVVHGGVATGHRARGTRAAAGASAQGRGCPRSASPAPRCSRT